MNNVCSFPVIGLAGWSGSGKTTLLEKLIPALKARGIGVTVIKHDVHGLKTELAEDGTERDARGTDSWRFANAGASQVILCGPGGPDLAEALNSFANDPPAELSNSQYTDNFSGMHSDNPSTDKYPDKLSDKPLTGKHLVLVEGFKRARIPKIGICREENGKGFTAHLSEYIAVVTDVEVGEGAFDKPVFGLNDIENITDFIEDYYERFYTF